MDFSLSFRVPLSCQCNLGNDWFTIYWHSNWPVFHIWSEITDKINQSRPTHKTGRKCQSRYSGQKLVRKPPQILLMWMNCQAMVSAKNREVPLGFGDASLTLYCWCSKAISGWMGWMGMSWTYERTSAMSTYGAKNGIRDAYCTADILDCPRHTFRWCPRHASDMPKMMPQTCPRWCPDMLQMMPQTCPRWCPKHAPDDALDMPQMFPQMLPRTCSSKRLSSWIYEMRHSHCIAMKNAPSPKPRSLQSITEIPVISFLRFN